MARRSIVTGVMQVLFFYLNAYLLLPVLYLKKKKILRYVLCLAGLLFLHGLVQHLFFNEFDNGRRGPAFGFIFPVIMVLAASTAFALLKERIRAAAREQELKTQNLQSELAFLRSQINPHFIFNVLNGMVSLARRRSDKLEPLLIKLSGLMRYSLYDADTLYVSLQRELEYVENYIELQRLRFGEEILIRTSITYPEEDLRLSPMLLIPFIENAFKHGTAVPEAALSVDIRVTDGTLYLRVLNRFDKQLVSQEPGGIGLRNVKRRLELLYAGCYNLTITEKIDFFVVSLELKLDNEKDQMPRN